MSKKRFYHKRKFWAISGIILISGLLFIGPWPIDQKHYSKANYTIHTRANLDKISFGKPSQNFRIGIAQVDITPPVGEPMAGYGARTPMTSTGIAHKIFVKALSIADQKKTITIVTADLLLITPELRAAVLKTLQAQANEIYFAATHTHAGPGGFAPQKFYQLVFGEYRQKILHRITGQMVKAIRSSRKNMKSAYFQFQRKENSGTSFISNRFEQDASCYQTIFILKFIDEQGKNIAALVVASAHATCLSSKNRKISGDYPGTLCQALEQKLNCPSLFMAGAVGSMGPATKATAQENGNALASIVLSAMADMKTLKQMAIEYTLLPIKIPSQHYRLSENWRLSPFLMNIIHDDNSFIQILRLGPVVFLGMPCDYSGELAMTLEQRLTNSKFVPIITSFNGDYIGYLVPEQRYRQPHYESRTMNFGGPWCGEYFNELAFDIIKKIESETCEK